MFLRLLTLRLSTLFRRFAHFSRAARVVLSVAGAGLILIALTLFTPLPGKLHHWLSRPPSTLEGEPQVIVVLGGGGIPSESGLMRTYYGAQMAQRHPHAEIVISLPEPPYADHSALDRMRGELVLRGVDGDRILMAPYGANTRAQAVELMRMYGRSAVNLPILLVSSPEHMRRASAAFRQVGFRQVGSVAAFDTYDGGDYAVTPQGTDSELNVPALENSARIRYGVWSNLNLLARCSRELAALAYYRLKGWI